MGQTGNRTNFSRFGFFCRRIFFSGIEPDLIDLFAPDLLFIAVIPLLTLIVGLVYWLRRRKL